jgi:hypothetical protein
VAVLCDWQQTKKSYRSYRAGLDDEHVSHADIYPVMEPKTMIQTFLW